MDENKTSRRNFIKLAALSGVGFCANSANAKVVSCGGGRFDVAQVEAKRNLNRLGVSAMGFGCMGLNHHRSAHPDKKMAVALVCARLSSAG